MARRRTIVGLGEALLREHAERSEPDGLAAQVALHAVRLGHAGIVISRIGQDQPAGELIDRLVEAGVDTSHIQHDPDLPTGRIVERALGDPVTRYHEVTTAFDNLQADFDLEDVAQVADAVVFGLLTRRSGQTRSEENRFLEACSAALKIFDLTNRGRGDVERSLAESGVALADAIVTDADGLRALRPTSNGTVRETATALLREERLSLIVVDTGEEAGGRRRLELHTADETANASIPAAGTAHVAAIVTVIDALLRGRGIGVAARVAERVSAFTVEQPSQPIPGEWLADAGAA